MNDKQPTQTIVVPRWRGIGQYLFIADPATGNIKKVIYRDDSFLRIGKRD